MAPLTANVHEMGGRTDIAHIPPMPLWAAIIRIFQLVLAIIVLGLTAYADNTFNYAFSGFGMAFFVFAWTLLFLAYIGVSAAFVPTLYNMWIHLGLEILTVIFWLVTWALLASEASVWSDYESTSYTVYGHTYTTSNYLPPKWKTAIDCAKASAGIGALEWVLFVITLVFFGISLFKLRAAEGAVGAPSAVAPMEEHKMNNIAMQQPEMVDPRYGGHNMA